MTFQGDQKWRKKSLWIGQFLTFHWHLPPSLPLLVLFANFFSVKSGDTMFSILIGDEGNEISREKKNNWRGPRQLFSPYEAIKKAI